MDQSAAQPWSFDRPLFTHFPPTSSQTNKQSSGPGQVLLAWLPAQDVAKQVGLVDLVVRMVQMLQTEPVDRVGQGLAKKQPTHSQWQFGQHSTRPLVAFKWQIGMARKEGLLLSRAQGAVAALIVLLPPCQPSTDLIICMGSVDWLANWFQLACPAFKRRLFIFPLCQYRRIIKNFLPQTVHIIHKFAHNFWGHRMSAEPKHHYHLHLHRQSHRIWGLMRRWAWPSHFAPLLMPNSHLNHLSPYLF